MNRDFAKKPEFLRLGFKLTKLYISKQLGISVPTLSKKERGMSEWTREEMLKLADIYKNYDPTLTVENIFFN